MCLAVRDHETASSVTSHYIRDSQQLGEHNIDNPVIYKGTNLNQQDSANRNDSEGEVG